MNMEVTVKELQNLIMTQKKKIHIQVRIKAQAWLTKS